MSGFNLQGGEIIRELRNETGTKIKIEDPTPDCEDRVVTILGPDRQAVVHCAHLLRYHRVKSAVHGPMFQYEFVHLMSCVCD